MSVGYVFFVIGLIVYIFVGIWFEECDFIVLFGYCYFIY